MVRRVQGLDGLRGLAVVAVVAYHLRYAWAPGGFLGVSLFFVLSGFLITGILLGQLGGGGRIAWRSFYARRARRLLPALALVLLAFAVVTRLTAAPASLDRLRGDALSAMAYVANWRFIAAGATYGSATSPLDHTWSLAIEEQFYLAWPLVLWVLWRATKGRPGPLLAAVVLLAAASAAAMGALAQGDPSRVYYGTDTRAFELMIGAALAVAVHRRPIAGWSPGARRVATTAAVPAAVVAAVLVAAARWSSPWVYPVGMLAFSLSTAALVAAAHHGAFGRVLSFRPLVWIGSVSYGLYLWHWPVIVWLSPHRVGFDGWVLDALRVAVTLAGATLSYHLVERPVLRAPLRMPALRWAAPAMAASIAAVVLVATTGGRAVASAGFHTGSVQVSGVIQAAPAPADRATAVASGSARGATTPVGAATGVSAPPVPGPPAAPPAPGGPAPLVAVIGDSVAFTAVYHALPAPGVRLAGATVLGCGLGPNGADAHSYPVGTPCSEAVPAALHGLSATRPDFVVWITGIWEQVSGAPERAVRDGWDRTLATVRSEAPGAVNVVAPEGCLGAVWQPADGMGEQHPEVMARVIRRWARDRGLPVIDSDRWLCDPSRRDDATLRPDGMHFGEPRRSAPFVEFLARAIRALPRR